MTINRIAAVTTAFTLSLAVVGQDKKQANQDFDDGNYEDALEEFLLLLEEEPEDLDYNYKLGVCYLNTNIDKSKAVRYFEFVTSDEKVDPIAWFLLGRSYQFAYEFDKAIEAFTEFERVAKKDAIDMEVSKQIMYCENARARMAVPLNVTFENLGEGVNTPFADYYPFVPADESFVIYNARREGDSETLPNGTYAANFYLSEVKNGEFVNGHQIGKEVSTDYGDEEVVGLSSDGSRALLFINNFDHQGDLFIADVVDGELQNVEKLPKEINSTSHEIAATISPDGKAIYFASDRSGGYGGVDLYVSRVLPNGEWSTALNLGPSINTAEDEDFPNLSVDGKTLFFSSRGHTSIGGYDIFKASWDAEKGKWAGVVNVGYPINTPDDDMNYRESETGRYGYIATLRSDGFGDLDIYRVTFNEVDPRYTVINGIITAEDGVPSDAYITVTDLETYEIYGDYLPNPKTNRYVIILPPGKFEIVTAADGYEDQVQEVEIFDKISFRAEINRDIKLTPSE